MNPYFVIWLEYSTKLNIMSKSKKDNLNAGYFFLGTFFVGLLVIAIYASVSRNQDLYEYTELSNSNATTQAEVIQWDDIGHGSYEITYVFDASYQGMQQEFTKEEKVIRGKSEEKYITIIYVPTNPNISRVTREFGPPSSFVDRMLNFCFLLWFFPVAGIYHIWKVYREETMNNEDGKK